MSSGVARLPAKDTPTAAADHVSGPFIRRQLESVEALAHAHNWDQVLGAARILVVDKAAPADVVQRVHALAIQAEAGLLVEDALRRVVGKDWPLAEKPIDRVLAMPGLPAILASQAREIRDSVKASLVALSWVDGIQAHIEKDFPTDPFQAVELMQTILDRLHECEAGPKRLPQIRERVCAERKNLTCRLEEALPEAQAAVETDRALATEWAEKLNVAAAASEWATLATLLADQPQLRHWPEKALNRADAAQRRLDDHRAEQQRLAVIKADHGATHC